MSVDLLDDTLGQRVRAARLLRDMPLRKLAASAGVSSSFLSQLENDLSSASISSLKKIAESLGVTTAELIDGSTSHSRGVLRSIDRPHYQAGDGVNKYLLTPPPLRNLEVYFGTIDADGSTGDEPYTHGNSQELFVCLKGSVLLHLGHEQHTLLTGDSIEFLSSSPHKVVNVGSDVAEVLWVCSPPTD
ncbi:cupin domain-containing protein [Saxibacter everestensis]|uniref:Cupin domain-containing protein n=1 Tax=Saxibacter everestensis TaxID=2909229 RepID=A0ABY8QUI6_9MICO|nr:cupin domain-containing protein [Brevibacteriaceae bacterium ZFBP1038]